MLRPGITGLSFSRPTWHCVAFRWERLMQFPRRNSRECLHGRSFVGSMETMQFIRIGVVALIPMLAAAQSVMRTDYHEHLLSPTVAALLGLQKPFLASDLIAELDEAGVRQAV